MRKCYFILLGFILLFVFGCNNNLLDTKADFFIVTFDSDGGSDVAKQTIEKGCAIVKPNDPTKEGNTFDGWYVGDEKWSFINDTVNSDLTLKAHWLINQYTLTVKYY